MLKNFIQGKKPASHAKAAVIVAATFALLLLQRGNINSDFYLGKVFNNPFNRWLNV